MEENGNSGMWGKKGLFSKMQDKELCMYIYIYLPVGEHLICLCLTYGWQIHNYAKRETSMNRCEQI